MCHVMCHIMCRVMCRVMCCKSLIFTGGGTHPQCNPTNGHTYFPKGGTHPQCNPTNGHTNFFDVSARIYASCARIFARIFMKIWLVVKYYFINISFKFHKDLSFL